MNFWNKEGLQIDANLFEVYQEPFLEAMNHIGKEPFQAQIARNWFENTWDF